MASPSVLHGFRRLALLAGVTLLHGCAPVPWVVGTGYHYDSRSNIFSTTPDFIVAGKTTRREVLLHMGEPDSVWIDESVVSYSTAYDTGGAAVFVLFGVPNAVYGLPVGGGETEFRRLVVSFDAQGIVRDARLEKKRCAYLMQCFADAAAIEPGTPKGK